MSFEQLHTANIQLKLTKCDLFKSQSHCLRHLLSQDSVSPLLEKKTGCNKKYAPNLRNIKKLRQFLGLTGYYRNRINHDADIPNVLIKLLKRTNLTCGWNYTKKLFLNSKTIYKHAPMIIYSDPNKPYL